jgi:protein-L-isoaspartate(D-aspartate) O-methyltransferase
MLDVQPGQRILEIGAGTGYNAALLAHLVGPTGHITTIDLDQDIVDSAWAHLEAAGFQHVQVICGDGYSGYREYAPYDRIVVTAATQDIAAAWWDQLMDGGRLVVPLAIPPLYVQHVFPWKALIAFNKHGDVMVSDAFGNCNFMPLRGASSSMPTPGMALNEQVRLTADERQIDHDALVVALKGPRRDVVTHVNVSLPDMAGLGLWLTLRDPNVCLLYMNGPMVEPYLGLDLINGTRITLGPNSGDGIPITFGSMCMTSVSLLVPRQASLDDTSVQLVVQSFGPDETLAQRLIEHICAWDHAGRPFKYGRFEPARTPLQIYAYPLSKQYSPATNELSVQKAWTHLVFSFGI